jgi:phage gpG-like protein
MAKKKNIHNVYDSDGPWVFIHKLLDEHPKLANYAMKRLAYEIVIKARRYVREGKPGWDPLYYKGPEVGQSTIKWNDYPEEPTSDFRLQRAVKRDRNIPLSDTGELEKSIKVITTGSNKNKAFATVGSLLEKAKILEFGGPNPLPNHQPIPGRPFMTPALIEVKNSNYIKRKVRQEIKAILKNVGPDGKIKLPNIRMPD